MGKFRSSTIKSRAFALLALSVVLQIPCIFVVKTSRELQTAILQSKESFVSTQDTTTGRRYEPKTALVMRSVDPIDDCIIQRIIAVCELLNQSRKYEHYTFMILLDQTFLNTTSTTTMQQYFDNHNASHLRAPDTFHLSERRVRLEFPELSNGYMTQKLVDGTIAKVPNRPFMWQLLALAVAIFSRYHPDYSYTWVFEEDVWSIGMPLSYGEKR